MSEMDERISREEDATGENDTVGKEKFKSNKYLTQKSRKSKTV